MQICVVILNLRRQRSKQKICQPRCPTKTTNPSRKSDQARIRLEWSQWTHRLISMEWRTRIKSSRGWSTDRCRTQWFKEWCGWNTERVQSTKVWASRIQLSCHFKSKSFSTGKETVTARSSWGKQRNLSSALVSSQSPSSLSTVRRVNLNHEGSSSYSHSSNRNSLRRKAGAPRGKKVHHHCLVPCLRCRRCPHRRSKVPRSWAWVA